VESLLPARWAAASLPHLSGAQLGQVESAVEVGVAPVTRGVPAEVAAAITRVSHDVFTSGMETAFVVASLVAAAGALVALLTRRPDEQDEAARAASAAPAQPAEVS
jgi:hypothetical protein